MTSVVERPDQTAPDEEAPRREQSRARDPHTTGYAEREGGRVWYEVYGKGDPPIVFVPPWQIVHSRVWKAQIPDFARRHLVVAYDGRGNGRSDRPSDPRVHTVRARAADLGAVMDATAVDAAVLVGLSSAAGPMIVFAAEHPERVRALVFVCPSTPFGERQADGPSFEDPLPSDEGWNKENIHYWRRDYRGYLEFFFGEAFPEPHSTKQVEDAVGYGLDTDFESLAATMRTPPSVELETLIAMCAGIHQPTLIIQGIDDRITHWSQGPGLASRIPGSRLVMLEGSGHIANARDPVVVNLLIRDLVRGLGRTGR